MNVYTTEFPTKPGTTPENVLEICHTWLRKSPHYKLKKLQPLTSTANEVTDFSDEQNEVYVADFTSDAGRRLGVQHTRTELGRRKWTSEIVAAESQGGLWVTININCEMLVPGESPPVPKKPLIISQLFSRIGGGNDGPFTTQNKPIQLESTQLNIASSVILGTSTNHLPTVYISCGFNGRHPTDPTELAERLSGLAHVIVEPNRYFSLQLAKQVSSSNPYGGALGLFWPGNRGRSIRYLPSAYESIDALLNDLEGDLRLGWLFWRSPRSISWAQLKEAISTRKINELRQSGSGSLDDFVAAFDQENAALRIQIQTEQARREILEEALRAIQSRELTQGDIRFSTGKETELYPGELKDSIIRTLREDQDSFSAESRRGTVIADFLKTNQPSETPDELEKTIKDLLSKTDRIASTHIKSLTNIGFDISDGGKHHKAVFRNDPRLSFTLFKTASDNRAGKNLAGDMIRILLKR